MKTIRGIVTASTDRYVPTQVLCTIMLNEHQEVYAVHRVDNGAGTFLFSAYDRKNTRYISMEVLSDE